MEPVPTMRPISNENKEIINSNPYFKVCARKDEGNCGGRITIDHTIIYGGKQLDELWSLVPVCEYHHAVGKFQAGGDLNREKHVYIALQRATDDQLRAISKAVDYIALRDRLRVKYGKNSN